jgi:hypothetical protein
VAVATVIAAAAAVIEPTTVMVAAIAPAAIAATVVAPLIVMPTVIASMTTISTAMTTSICPGIGRSGRGAQGDCHAEHNDKSTQLPQRDMCAVVELGVRFGREQPSHHSLLLNHLVSDAE